MLANHPARIFFLLARKVNKAIVFRRGPTKWTQMIVWDLDSDKLDYGQWSKAKFQKWRCDLSPSGKYLIYLNNQFEDGDSYTVISKPPYWNALTKWTHYNPLFGLGGGIFNSEHTIVLNWPSMLQADELFPVPQKAEVICNGVFQVEKVRLERDGWCLLDSEEFVSERMNNLQKPSMFWNDIYKENKFQAAPDLWSKQITENSFLYRLSYIHPEKIKRLSRFFIKKKQNINELEDIEWADVDHNGRIIATKKGTLMASKRLRDNSVQTGNLEILYDLNSLKPVNVFVPDEMKKW